MALVDRGKGNLNGRFEGVRDMVNEFQLKARTKEPTVADYIRLVTLERELRGEEMVNEVRVTWVQKFGMESDT